MTESRWVMIRVDRTTRDRLEQVRNSLLAAQENGQVALEVDARDRVSLDQVINRLIDMRADHKARRRRAQAKARFDAMWEKLAEESRSDGLGGMEYNRVFEEWLASGLVNITKRFIIERANIGPHED